MWSPAQTIRAHRLGAMLVSCFLGFLAPLPGIAQTTGGVVPITSEPEHKIRFDNGKVRLVEVVLPRGKSSLFHEHRADAFFVFFRTAEITSEPFGGKPVATTTPAGSVQFRSTADGPYVRRVIASGEETVHVSALELLAPAAPDPSSALQDRFPPFEIAMENSSGRIYRLKLGPGESTEAFTRPAGTAIFAISSGRVSEKPEGKPERLWDFEPGHFRWVETGEELSLRNESAIPIEWVEIEVF